MKVENYSVLESTNLAGELRVEITHDRESYSLVFSYVRRCFGPHEHGPFPTGNKKVYAWPSEDIPSKLKAEKGSQEALDRHIVGIDSQLDDDIVFLANEYNKCENVNKSPFVEY